MVLSWLDSPAAAAHRGGHIVLGIFNGFLANLQTQVSPGRIAASASVAALALLLAACGGGPNPTPTPDPPTGPAQEEQGRVETSRPGGSGPTGSSTASPTPSFGATLRTPPLPQPGPDPTPNPDNSDWVQQRLNALIRLYDLTPSGAALLRSLDIRQMRGNPGFFGSYGFKGWAGVGEAKPIGVVHEIGHSYWGGFPVPGFPELSWETPPGAVLSPAMERYHADILSFMAQPPDDYEVFRQRLRNLPDLSSDNREPLFHNVEAGLVYGTGGNLALVPPILRRYWSRFLKDGPFDSWYDALAWHQSLSGDGRAAANKYLGFEHLDLRQYGSLSLPSGVPDLIPERAEILAGEERQRQFDLADQFELLLGDPQKGENFQFWRGYLRDKVELYRLHKDYLPSLDLPRAADLASALGFLNELTGLSPEEQAGRMAGQLPAQPFLVNFLPTLDNRTLLQLFSTGTALPRGATLQATASFVERLQRFSGVVEGVMASGRADPRRAAGDLGEFLSEIGFEQKEDLRLFFDLFRDADPATAGRVVLALVKDTVRRLMEPVPAQLRFLLTAEELSAKLDITAAAGVAALKRGVVLLVEEPSGNFMIDEPFLEWMYQVVAGRSGTQARDVAEVLMEPAFPLEGFIQQHPRAAVAILAQDLESAVRRVLDSDPVLSPPARIVYRLISADPAWTARLVVALEEKGEEAVVVESLAYFAYDKDRLEWLPQLPISLEQDGRFLETLFNLRGGEWLAGRLEEAFTHFAGLAAANQVSPDFLSHYRATLAAAAATIADSFVGDALQGIIDGVAETTPAG